MASPNEPVVPQVRSESFRHHHRERTLLPTTLADSGYDGAGQGIHTPIKQPGNGQALAPDHQAYNTLLRSTRCLGERGFALLTGRCRTLRRITASPRRIGNYVTAALVLTHIEQLQLRTSR